MHQINIKYNNTAKATDFNPHYWHDNNFYDLLFSFSIHFLFKFPYCPLASRLLFIITSFFQGLFLFQFGSRVKFPHCPLASKLFFSSLYLFLQFFINSFFSFIQFPVISNHIFNMIIHLYMFDIINLYIFISKYVFIKIQIKVTITLNVTEV